MSKHTLKNKKKLIHLIKWIEVIGDKYGAKDHYFRNESETSDTSALPPKGKEREPVYIEEDDSGNECTISNNLRLYCMRLNDNVVFLFNGDIKTTLKAQDCENVKPHFRQANFLSSLIDKAFREREINWNNDCTDIVFDDGFNLLW